MANKTEGLLQQVSDLGIPELIELIKRASIRLRFLKREAREEKTSRAT